MIQLQSVHLKQVSPEIMRHFPFSVPALGAFAGLRLEFSSPVTFLIGENGSGKSTFLEALAYAAQSIAVAADSLDHDPTLASARALGSTFKLAWSKRTRRGFFMRSEDFFGYAKRMQVLRAEAEADLQAVQNDPTLSETACAFGSLPHARTIQGIKQRYGAGLDTYSHGESFFTLFKARFVPDGLYLLDEPEAPLSPKRQLALISMLKMLVEEHNAQFIIATHSPILMAFPKATIYSFDDGQLRQVAYNDVEHVTIMRDFLQHPESFLRHL